MNFTWLDILFLVIGGIALAVFAYCLWNSFQSLRANRAKPPNKFPGRPRD